MLFATSAAVMPASNCLLSPFNVTCIMLCPFLQPFSNRLKTKMPIPHQCARDEQEAHGSTRIILPLVIKCKNKQTAISLLPAVTGRARQGFAPALCGGRNNAGARPLAARRRPSLCARKTKPCIRFCVFTGCPL